MRALFSGRVCAHVSIPTVALGLLVLLPGAGVSSAQDAAKAVKPPLYEGKEFLGDSAPSGDPDQLQPMFYPQVEIRALFISFKQAAIEELLRQQPRVDVASLRELWRNGHGALVASPSVLTQPGEEATVKGTEEYIYPEEYRVEGGETDTSTNTCRIVGRGPMTVPQSFATREVGVILTAKPEVSPDYEIVTLTLSPDLVDPPEWHKYPGYSDAEMPFFKRHTVTTTVRMKDGDEALVGGGMNNPDGKQVMYLIVGATLLGPDGKRWRKQEPDKGRGAPKGGQR